MAVLTQLWFIFVADPSRLLAETKTAEEMCGCIKEINDNVYA